MSTRLLDCSRAPDSSTRSTPSVRLALLYCIALFYAMKMMAHVMQQTVFGEGLGKMVAIRSLIGVNSDMIWCEGSGTWGSCAGRQLSRQYVSSQSRSN